jgi:hypothetical protein
MPTFRSPRPNSIASSVAALLSSSGVPDAKDLMAAETARSHINYQNTLAEKVRQEVEDMRAAAAARSDPRKQTEYAALQSGIDIPQGNQLRDNIYGNAVPQQGPDEEGNALPDAVLPKPSSVSPVQERQFRTALAATVASMLGSGKTNAQQLAAAGDHLQTQGFRNQLDDPTTAPDQRYAAADAVSGRIGDRYKLSSNGESIIRPLTGDVTDSPTQAAQLARQFTQSRTKTEGTRQDLNKARAGEAGARAGAANASADLSRARKPVVAAQQALYDARRGAIERGASPGGKAINPIQAERWISQMATKEWDALSLKERKAMPGGFEGYRNKRRAEVMGQADAAVKAGADPAKVAERLRQQAGALDDGED